MNQINNTMSNTSYDPWEIAYVKLKEHYTREQIDEMMWCEIEELLSYHK